MALMKTVSSIIIYDIKKKVDDVKNIDPLRGKDIRHIATIKEQKKYSLENKELFVASIVIISNGKGYK